MNRTWDHFSPFAEHTHWLLAMLAAGMEGDLPPVTFHSSKKGLTMKLRGVAVASGKTCRDLKQNWEREVAKAKAAKST